MTTSGITWRPASQTLERPADIAAAWQRLCELTLLSWPTLAEQTECAGLAKWLNPSGDGWVNDAHLFDVAATISNVNTRSDIGFLEPAFSAAGEAWENLCQLADGKKVAPPRSELKIDDPEDVVQAWWGRRRAQAADWFAGIMREVDALVSAGFIDSDDLPGMVTSHRLNSSLRRKFMDEAFDGPFAVGASLIFESGLLGTRFGHEGGVLYIVDALSVAVQNSTNALKTATEENEIRSARAHLSFLLTMLKGLIYAGAVSHQGVPLPDMYWHEVSRWEAVRKSLLDGHHAFMKSAPRDTRPVKWEPLGARLSELDARIPIEEVIRWMENRIWAAHSAHE